MQQQLTAVQQELDAVKRAFNSSRQQQLTAVQQQVRSELPMQAIAPNDYSYEDFEDEPDEILTEFLEPEPTQPAMPRPVTTKQAIALSGDESAAQCPQCASTRFAKWGKGKTGRQRLKCGNCGKIWTS